MKKSLILLLLWMPPAGLGGEDYFRRGDANLDGQVDISDPIAGFTFLFLGGEGLPCLDAADSNDDGAVDVSDGIHTLGFLFLGSQEPPAPGPGPCPGPDPTSDPLDCARGAPPPAGRPSIRFWAEFAPAPGLRQRRGAILPLVGGVYRAEAGVSFVLIAEGQSSAVTQAMLNLADPADPRAGNPRSLQVACDRDLGDPQSGGIPAGENLAPRFLNDIDLWTDGVFLIERAALRLDGGSPASPSPGRHRFRARITDAACAPSDEAALEIEVLPSQAPEVFLFLETDPAVAPDAPSAATGGLLLAPAGRRRLVVEGRPNGKSSSAGGAGADDGTDLDASSLELFSDPPLVPGSAAGENLAGRFDFLGFAEGGAARWGLELDPAAGWPQKGNFLLTASLAAKNGSASSSTQLLEGAISYTVDIQPVWTAECTGCHEKPDPFKGLELVIPGQPASRTRRNIVHVYAAEPSLDSAAPLLVWPYHPERSYLLHKLRGTHLDPAVQGSGERMPQDGPPYLDEKRVQLIEDWIAQGAAGD